MNTMQIARVNNRRQISDREGYRSARYSAPPVMGIGHLLWIHKGVFTLGVVVSLLLAALFSFSESVIYRARGTVELQVPPAASNGAEGGNVYGEAFDAYLDTQIGILQSDTLIRRLIARLNLEQALNRYHPEGLIGLRQKYLSFNMSSLPENERLFETVKKNLTVRQARLNDLIEINYDANDPEVAANVVNTLINEYQQQNLETRWQMSESAGKWFTQHLADLRKQLEASERQLQDYSRATGLLLISDADKDSVAKERLRQLQEALSTAQSQRIEREAQLDMSKSSAPDTVPQVLDNSALKEYEIKIADLERQLAQDKQIYTPTNPKILMLQSQITSLQAAWGRQRGSILSRISNEYSAALRNEKMLTTEYTAQQRIVRDQDEKMIRYETLKHDVDSNRTLYDSLLQKVKESGVSVALQATNVRVVDSAVPPVKPYRPNHLINLGVGLLAGLLLGSTLVVCRHRSDRSVRKPGVMQHYLATRELGVIPTEGQGPLARLGSFKSHGVRAWLGDPDSTLSTSFRSVMASIMFATKDLSRAKFAVITSPGPSEGKTTVAANLAAAFAATGRKVLLVDADLRRPHLHHVFDLPDSPGLSDLAQEVQSVGAEATDLDRYLKATTVPDLFVITSGTSASGTANLLHSLRFEEVFAALRQKFDTVLVDAPPLLSVPEARVMARLSDGVVLVVRAGSTSIDAAAAAEYFIREDGGTVIGTILNDAPHDSAPYYGGYRMATARYS